jgi:hypothetical protein
MDIERTMQFILEQQAQFASDIQILKEAAKAQEEQFGREIVRINSVLLEVAGSQERTSEILAVLAEKHVELANAQKVTEEKLHVLIDTVERHISNHNAP